MINITISDVEELVKRDFPPEKVKFVLETLDEYKNIIEVDKVRVWMAIVQLSCGDINKIKYFASEARIDPKKIIFLAE